MKLTGKCKKDFKQWLENTHNIHSTEWEELNKTCRDALIVDWFDSKIHIANQTYWEWFFYQEYKKTVFLDYKKATNEAIIKANIIYNENK